jgi:hypothetical protein
MRKLDRELCRRNASAGIENPLHCSFVLIRPKPNAAQGDSTFGQHVRRLDRDVSGTGQGHVHQVLEMPIGHAPIASAVLAHGRNPNPIRNFDAADS